MISLYIFEQKKIKKQKVTKQIKLNTVTGRSELPWLQKSIPGTRPSTQTISPCSELDVTVTPATWLSTPLTSRPERYNDKNASFNREQIEVFGRLIRKNYFVEDEYGKDELTFFTILFNQLPIRDMIYI